MSQSILSWRKIVLKNSNKKKLRKFKIYVSKTWGKLDLVDFTIEDMWGAIICFAFELEGICIELFIRRNIKPYDIHKWGYRNEKFKTPHEAMLYAARRYFK